MTTLAVQDELARHRADFLAVLPKIILPLFLGMIDQTIVAAALPSIAAELGGVGSAPLIVVAYLVAASIATPVYGHLGDRFGRHNLLRFALALYVVASGVCALSNSVALIIVARIGQGLGGGGLVALSHAIISQTIPPRARARYQGYLAAIAVTASVFGPVVGGVLTQMVGWRAVFAVNMPLGLLAVALAWRFPSQADISRDKHGFDWPGLFVFSIFVISTLGAARTAEDLASINWPKLALFGLIAIGAALIFLAVEARSGRAILPLGLLADPTIWRCYGAAALHGATVVSLATFLPLYLRTKYGVTPAEAGLLLVPMAIAMGVGSVITGRLVSSTGHAAVFPSVGLLLVSANLGLLAAIAPSLTSWDVAIRLATVSIFLGSVMAVIQVTVQSAAGKSLLSTATAGVQLSRTLGAAVGTTLITTLLLGSLPSAGREAFDILVAIEFDVGSLEFAPYLDQNVSIEMAFRYCFAAIGGLAAVSAALCWTMPIRHIR